MAELPPLNMYPSISEGRGIKIIMRQFMVILRTSVLILVDTPALLNAPFLFSENNETELQIRRSTEDNSKIIFLIFQ